MKYTPILLLMMLLSACTSTSKSPVEMVNIQRFDLDVAGYADLDTVGKSKFIDKYRTVTDILITPDSTKLDSLLTAYSHSRAVEMFTPDIIRCFKQSTADSLGEVLAIARDNMEALGLAYQLPKLYGVVSTYNQSIIVADTVMLVGINHYLGKDYEAYEGFDDYIRSLKTPERMPYDIIETILRTTHPYRSSSDETALNRILYEGAIIEATMEIIPDSRVETAMGYTPEMMKRAEEFESAIYNTLISRKLLYSTSQSDIDRLTRTAPSTSIVNNEAPGRAGTYIGYKIITAYRKKYKADVATLLDSAVYNSPTTFLTSGYSPR